MKAIAPTAATILPTHSAAAGVRIAESHSSGLAFARLSLRTLFGGLVTAVTMSLIAISLICTSPAREPIADKGWQLVTESDVIARLSGPGGVSVTLAGLTPSAEVEMHVAPNARAVAVLVRHRKVTEVMIYALTSDGGLREVFVPLVPASTILEKFPTAGKPEGKKFRLDDMSVARAGWGNATQFALTVSLGLVETTKDDPSWAYVVDVVYSVTDRAEASLTLLNVVLRNGSGS